MALWISHRGVREGVTVENTERAFQAAVTRGFKVLETDLRLTADHEIVLCHDIDFARLGGDTCPVLSRTRAQLENRPLADGQKPYFLDEFLKQHATQKWVLDIKEESGSSVLRILQKRIPEMMNPLAFTKNASFVLWTKDDEAFAKETFPGVKIYAGKKRCWRAGLSMLYAGGLASGVEKDDIFTLPPTLWGRPLFRKELVQKYHAKGARLLAFLPQSESDCRDALSAGFDEILSDGWLLR